MANPVDPERPPGTVGRQRPTAMEAAAVAVAGDVDQELAGLGASRLVFGLCLCRRRLLRWAVRW